MNSIRLITRGDDSGICRSANRAVLDAFHNGILRNTSLMIPGPAFAEAAALFRELPDLCVGCHGTLTCEWNNLRFGPVLGAVRVPSLVQPDGTFFKDCQQLWDNRPSYDEMVAELKAQIDLAREYGLNIAYLDTHMGFTWFPGLLPRLANLAQSERLVFDAGSSLANVQPLPDVTGDFADPVAKVLAALAAAVPGQTYRLVTHPLFDDEETRLLTYNTHLPGEIARQRDGDRRLLTDPRIREVCARKNIRPVRYDEVG